MSDNDGMRTNEASGNEGMAAARVARLAAVRRDIDFVLSSNQRLASECDALKAEKKGFETELITKGNMIVKLEDDISNKSMKIACQMGALDDKNATITTLLSDQAVAAREMSNEINGLKQENEGMKKTIVSLEKEVVAWQKVSKHKSEEIATITAARRHQVESLEDDVAQRDKYISDIIDGNDKHVEKLEGTIREKDEEIYDKVDEIRALKLLVAQAQANANAHPQLPTRPNKRPCIDE
jgi:chromosome segregation ATPase